MPLGPGKYDDEVTALRERFHAAGVVLIVIGGDRGQGFCAQLPLAHTLMIADMLESVAREIRASGGPLA
jgi:hypothetical protein